MAENEGLKAIEEIQAEFLEIPTAKGPEAFAKDLASKLLQNNYKMCLFAEMFEQEVEDKKIKNASDPKIEILKNVKAALEVLEKYHDKTVAENSKLKDELLELKLKRKQKRYFEKNRQSYVDYREKIFPMLMKDCDKKEEIMNELNKNNSNNISEKDLIQVTEELEKLKIENELLAATEANIVESRRQNEVIEVETCRIQVQNIEMENEIRAFDEYVMENQITVLEEKIRNAKASSSKPGEVKKKKEFKNPNDFPTLLDLLDTSKKYKHKKKRRLLSPSTPPSKRQKNKTGSYSLHNKNGNPRKNDQPQASPKSSPRRGKKNTEIEKVRALESIGLKVKNDTASNSGNSSSKEQSFKRTYSSRNLGKPSRPPLQRQNSTTTFNPSTSHPQYRSAIPTMTWSPYSNTNSTSSSRPPLQRQNSFKQLQPNKGTSDRPKTPMPPTVNENRVTRQRAYHELETDENGHLLLQRFSSGLLFPSEPEVPTPKPQKRKNNEMKNNADLKINNNRTLLKDKPAKGVPAKSDSLEIMETNVKDASVSKQPSTERGLRSRKNLKSQQISPKKTVEKEVNRTKVKSPKKSIKRGRNKRKGNKRAENEMIVDEESSSTDDNSNEIQLIDDDITMNPGDNADNNNMTIDKRPMSAEKSIALVENPITAEQPMVVDENPIIAEKSMVVDENPITSAQITAVDENQAIDNSVNSGLNDVPRALTTIPESTGNNEMDIYQNAQIEGFDDTNMPQITSNEAEEVMEQESPDNNISNFEIFDLEMENVDPDGSGEMSNSFERLFCSSPSSSGNIELNRSFDFNLDNSRELSGSDNGGNKAVDDFFNFETGADGKDDFFEDSSFKSNEGKADDFF